ncbi:hypothetical protein [Chromobacterium vaccinii]|uniref:hypothetical protein n=1 Tax=Chromobacterium vaccinii TaxID=1108595 RepID=UPI0011855205|nr:hypothetical protein [Chromobacterium vaccinii]
MLTRIRIAREGVAKRPTERRLLEAATTSMDCISATLIKKMANALMTAYAYAYIWKDISGLVAEIKRRQGRRTLLHNSKSRQNTTGFGWKISHQYRQLFRYFCGTAAQNLVMQQSRGGAVTAVVAVTFIGIKAERHCQKVKLYDQLS